MHIAGLASVIAQVHHARVQLVVIGHEHPAFSGGEGFGTMKTKRRHIAQRARLAPAKFTANRLGGVLDDDQSVLIGNRPQRIVIRRAAVQIHRENRLRLFRDARLHTVSAHAPRLFVDIREHRCGPHVTDRRRTGDPREIRHNHFIARTNARRRQRQVQPRGARGQTHRVFYTDVIRKGFLESPRIFACTIVPTIRGGIGRVINFPLRDARAGDGDAFAHQSATHFK